jgi:hypothetical protein
MSSLHRVVVVAGSVGAFLLAAKAHGHQLRLERQLAGFWQVSFRAPNDPWVEALWQRERLAFWVVALVLAAAGLAYSLYGVRAGWPQLLAREGSRWSGWGLFLAVVAWPAIVAFAGTGIASFVRFLARRSDADWMARAVWASVGWWAATLVIGLALLLLAIPRRA